MEASALTRASKRGLLARRTPLLRMESDARLVALIRAGHDSAFEALFNRYHSRLLGFCQSMLKSRQDAEDVLQEVFTNAHSAMLADEREINVRPWLYRIARNRCLNHLRKPVPDGQDSMDVLPFEHGTSTAERVQNREELRQLMADVDTLPETQRTALLLREIDQMTYEEIAQTMQTTVPSVKSLLVRARIGLAESSQARLLTCGEVQVKLAEAAEGLAKTTGPVRKHVRDCEECKAFRNQLRADQKALASIVPVGILGLLKGGLLAKLFGGSAGGAGSASVGGAAAGAGSVGAIGGAAAGTTGGAGAIGGIAGALGGAVGTKAVAGVATAALLTAGAVEVGSRSGGKEATQLASAPVSAPRHGKAVPALAKASKPPKPATAAVAVKTSKPIAPEEPTTRSSEPATVPAEPAGDGDAPAEVPDTPSAETPPQQGEVAIGAPPSNDVPADAGTPPSAEPAEVPVAEPITPDPDMESAPISPTPEPAPEPTPAPEPAPTQD